MRHWFNMVDAYDVCFEFILCPPDCPLLEGEDALTDFELNKVYICDSGNDNRIKILAFHEMNHINLSPPGSPGIRRAIFGVRTVEKADKIEESLVTFQSPPLFAMLTKNGFLKLPDIPRAT